MLINPEKKPLICSGSLFAKNKKRKANICGNNNCIQLDVDNFNFIK